MNEKGQALVEFALVLPVFLVLAAGVIDFGRAITYWLDLNNSAQVAARYAVVNRYPGCFSGPSQCSSPNTFKEWVLRDLNSGALKAGGGRPATVLVCYEDVDGSGAPNPGDGIRVTLTSPYNFIPYLSDATGLGAVSLRGRATLRLELNLTRIPIDGKVGTPPC